MSNTTRDKTLEEKYLRLYNKKRNTHYLSWDDIPVENLKTSLMSEMAYIEFLRDIIKLLRQGD